MELSSLSMVFGAHLLPPPNTRLVSDRERARYGANIYGETLKNNRRVGKLLEILLETGLEVA